ncbi:MAG TPA: CaiB/BaiF CoA-transferase family protein [Syntrophales bacterium]|nr:CaiB/BaiF CoA-transferase family protein [Syntrophales bacterium]
MPGALEGVKVLDFTTLLPGPYATMYLADMGADVLRIASRSRPDLVDFFPPYLPGSRFSAASAQLGRNKRLLTLNLKDPRSLKIIHRLISEYDVVVEQFRPGVMAKLKLDYDSLKAVNPAVIYCSITGYGQTGPMRDRAGHDMNYMSRSGVMSYSGKKETGPSLMGIQIADVASGSNNAVIGILAAIVYRNRTGKGQAIDISMTDGVVALNAMYGAGFLVDGRNPEREKTLLNGGSLYDFYETSDGGHISFGGLEPQFFTNFFNTIGKPEFISGGVSPKNIAEVKKEVREIIRSRTKNEWLDIFSRTDACVEPVMTLSEVFSDPLILERGMVVDVPAGAGKQVRQIANPIKFSETPPEYRGIGVSAAGGAHTKEVMAGLGFSEKEIEEFEKTGLFD